MSQLPDPVLLVGGTARSGTTLIRNMLAAHPMLAVPDESHFIGEVLGELQRRGRPDDMDLAWELVQRHPLFVRWGADREYCEDVIRRHPPADYGDLIRALFAAFARARGKPMTADKTTHHALRLPMLAELFPTSRFVHVLRDPRAVVMSLALQPWISGGIVGAAQIWRDHVSRARAASTTLGDRLIEVRYESLIADPRAELERICRLGQLDFHAAMLEHPGSTGVLIGSIASATHHQSARGAVGPNPRRWESEMSRDDIAAVELVAGDVMEAAGYRRVSSRPTLRAIRDVATYRLDGRWRELVRRRWGIEGSTGGDGSAA